MKDYKNDTPIFSEIIKIAETSDPAHADIVNKAPIQIFQNTLCNRESIERLKKNTGATEEYNSEASYLAGDYCLYQNMLYKCVQETSGEWNPACWQQTSALEEIEGLRGTIVQQEAAISSLEEMLVTGNVLTELITKDGNRFVSAEGDTYKALKKIQFM